MCTHQREIVNKYTGHKLYVKCGHCPACLQEKASYRVSRIKATDHPDLETLMVTLTYARNNCPYVFRDDAYLFSQGKYTAFNLDLNCEVYMGLPVYRDTQFRKVRISSDYMIGYKMIKKTVQLCEIPFEENCSFKFNRDLSHCHNKIGVCYYPDIQHFIARLRLNLLRKYEFTGTFKTYCTSEYGSRSLRPHFHLLLWIPKGTFETFRNAIVESWPFSNLSKFDRAVERAFRASSYVASYVNCNTDFPEFLKTYFRPKHSYSKDFGCNYDFFQLPAVLERINRGSLTYFSQKTIDGFLTIAELPIPKYVIHRYFPKFKGYSRIAPPALSLSMQRLKELGTSTFNVEKRLSFLNRIVFPVYYDISEIHSISVRLVNAYEKFKELSKLYDTTFKEYCDLHQRAWRVYYSSCLRLSMSNSYIPLNEKYDNLEEIRCKLDCDLPKYVDYPMPIGFSRDMLVVTNPNDFNSVQASTMKYTVSYFEHLKHRNVSNVILSSINEEF